MQKPKVSILMTVYNHQKYVIQAIRSILNQNYRNFEFIIFNNGSTDNTKNLITKIKDKRIKLFNLKKNVGRTSCLNLGLKKCKGEYIAIQDSDDISKKNRISNQVNFLIKNEQCGLVGTNYSTIDDMGNLINSKVIKSNFIKNPKLIIHGNFIGHSTVMYRKKVLSFSKGYPNEYLYAQDYAFYLKLITKFNISILDKDLAFIRLNHIESESQRLRKTSSIQKEEIRIIFWILRNIETKIFQKIKIISRLAYLFLKIILYHFT